jgi:dihydrofolate reductase
MRLTLHSFVTLDGVVQGPGGPEEDTDGGFDRGGWVVPYFDDDMMATVVPWFDDADAFLFGRRTYDIFAGSWGTVDDPNDPVATAFNSHPKYVASRTLDELSWSGSTLLEGDVAAAVAALKEQPGRELQLHGSGALGQTLIRHGLVDEYRLLTFPVVLGKGKRLFPDGAKPTAFKVVEHKLLGSGVSVETYQAAGEPGSGFVGVGDELKAAQEGA